MSNDSKTRLAFLGIDNPHGSAWRDLFRENFADRLEITALMPGFDGATTSLEESLNHLPRFDSVDDLIANGGDLIDAAFIGLPNNETPTAAVKLARAGKHILVEKPMAGSAEPAKPVAEAVSESGVNFQSGFIWRYDEIADRLRDMVADGRFGKRLINVEISFTTSDVKKRDPDHYLFDREISGGGFFNWLACHQLDLLFYITGQKIAGVTARTGVFGQHDCEVEDGGAVIMDLSGGGIATFVGGYWLPRWAGESHWSFRGGDRWVHWDPGRAGTGGALDIHGPQPQWNAMEEVFELPPDSTPGYGGNRAVKAVADWLDGGENRNTPQSTVDTLALLDAIAESSETGHRVTCEIG
ncbi:MAG: Gfo/Idh/MocA family oxidoreductase [Verrucomicrobiales bacterium]|nr:Gfo/Idh/MocA family oxidoreductase [Verrucomicrobiales bacterium]